MRNGKINLIHFSRARHVQILNDIFYHISCKHVHLQIRLYTYKGVIDSVLPINAQILPSLLLTPQSFIHVCIFSDLSRICTPLFLFLTGTGRIKNVTRVKSSRNLHTYTYKLENQCTHILAHRQTYIKYVFQGDYHDNFV